MSAYQALYAFSSLTVISASIALGLCIVIMSYYWHVFKKTKNARRLLPTHVMLIATSYAMISVVAVARLGNPPPPETEGWWIYPFITAAFILGDIALVIILRFIRARGSRY